MSDWIGTQGGDWAAAHQRQTLVTGKASPPLQRGQAPLFSPSFSLAEGRAI